MNKLFRLIVFTCVLMPEVLVAQQNGEHILLGAITLDSLHRDTSLHWLNQPKQFNLNTEAVEKLQLQADKLFVKIYCGNWCEDTQNILPRFIQLANATGIKYSLYFLDRNKQSPGGKEKQDSVTLVPTFILLYNNSEIGRVIELAPRGIENHLSGFLK